MILHFNTSGDIVFVVQGNLLFFASRGGFFEAVVLRASEVSVAVGKSDFGGYGGGGQLQKKEESRRCLYQVMKMEIIQ